MWKSVGLKHLSQKCKWLTWGACQSITLTELTNCKMRGWNGHEVIHLTVLEHYITFMVLVETLDQTRPNPSNICTLYYECWHDDMK